MDEGDGGVLRNLPRARPGTRSAKRERPRKPPPIKEPAPPSEEGVLGTAVRTAGSLAGLGVRVTGRVSRELLRRFPRP